MLPTIILRTGDNETIAVGKMIATTNGQDLTIGGFPAYYGEFMGSLMWIEKNGRTLDAAGPVWSETGDAAVAEDEPDRHDRDRPLLARDPFGSSKLEQLPGQPAAFVRLADHGGR